MTTMPVTTGGRDALLDGGVARIGPATQADGIVDTHGLLALGAKSRVAPVGADHDLRHDPRLRRRR